MWVCITGVMSDVTVNFSLPQVSILDNLCHSNSSFNTSQEAKIKANKQTSASISYGENFKDKEPLIPKMRGFKIASLNIASLLTHIDELRIMMRNNDIECCN